MVVLQFAWGGGTNNVHLPHMHYENSFCYVGTHDNETAVGWFADSANAQDKKYLKAYLGSDGKDIAWDFIKSAMASVSCTSIVLMQVCLGAVLSCRVLQGLPCCRSKHVVVLPAQYSGRKKRDGLHVANHQCSA
jgi:4-alpha-glucanotransferase